MTDLVFARNGQALTTSEVIAKGAGVEHRAILQTLHKYSEDFQTFNPLAFEMRKGKALPQGGFAKSTEYAVLSEQQATLLVTYCKNTEVVRKFKVALVKAFYDMRQKLMLSTTEKSSEVATITPEQQYLLKEAVKSKAKMHAAHYQTIYRAIYARYKIAKYDQLPQDKFKECLQFITEVNPNIPINPDREIVRPERCPVCGLVPLPEGSKVFTKDDQKKIAEAIRPLLQDAMESMRKIEEERSHAWTCFHEISLYLHRIC